MSAAISAISTSEYLSEWCRIHVQDQKARLIAAKPIPQVLRNINAFTLGAPSRDPTITTTVIFTGDWSMPVKKPKATTTLAESGSGCDHLPRR